MSKRRKSTSSGAMLELWRPPSNVGEPVGCLATTYTFRPELFDEQCLARFLEIESEPDREDLAFLLERESRLGGTYAGVLVDHTQAGVEHSLRWDVLPVRIRGGKQHAKLSLLCWERFVRIIVASANLSEPGYRLNHEIASTIDLTPDAANLDILGEAVAFLRSLLLLIPGAAEGLPEVQRAGAFLDQAERQVQQWKPVRRTRAVRQRLVVTLPAIGANQGARSSLDETVQACRGLGGSPIRAWIASPFFDTAEDTSTVTAALCKAMARGTTRELWIAVPAVCDETVNSNPRLAAPKALLTTPPNYQADVTIEMLPAKDSDDNPRPWHAKMLSCFSNSYGALMAGSSNFTCAGMGIGTRRNAEANLLTIVDAEFTCEGNLLEAIWPTMDPVDDPESAEWLGAAETFEEEEQAAAPVVPAGFLAATFRAGDDRRIILRFDPSQLPDDWQIDSSGSCEVRLLSAVEWRARGYPRLVELDWQRVQPPEKLLVRWNDQEGFLPLNVEDGRKLPPPPQLDEMSADDMLLILAAADPSAAFRAWARRRMSSESFDVDLDAALPADLDPLRRYDLHATFLHRIRRRARILAQLRANLQRPVWGRQALDWRLTGLIGIEPLATRLVRDFTNANGAADEALLTLADLLIVLREVEYELADGCLTKAEFDRTYRSFLDELATTLRQQVEEHRDRISEDLMGFWERVLEQCRG